MYSPGAGRRGDPAHDLTMSPDEGKRFSLNLFIMQDRQFYVYILTNDRRTVLYVGMTSDLARRLDEHRTKPKGAFTSRYNVHRLVYVEVLGDLDEALRREKYFKKGTRAKKVIHIERVNPAWRDLSDLL